MNLRTTFNIAPFPHKISHQSKLLAIGSCFATMIGKHMKDRKYDILVNPFGTIFNPNSVFSLLESSMTENKPSSEEIIQHDGKYIHYQYHSSIIADNELELLTLIQNLHKKTYSYLQKASHLFITLGTAYAYEHNGLDRTVSNCHKQPAALFTKRILDISEMETAFISLYKHIKILNPDIQIILTVSPVRHIKDGIPENQFSKSLLRVLVEQLVKQHENVHYFPSYEIMMDDLRDYRFYKEDLIHPTDQAERYIYNIFEKAYISQEDQVIDNKIMDLLKSIAHRPFNPCTNSHQNFLNKLVSKIEQMPRYLDFADELNSIRKQML